MIGRVFEATRRAGIPDEKMYVDPLAMTIATNIQAGQITFNTMRAMHAPNTPRRTFLAG